MLALYQVEELTRRRNNSALSYMQLAQSGRRSIRRGRTHEALDQLIEANIHSGASFGELSHEMITVLHRVAE